jgi:broad specificity phosphatase PhoE
MTTLILARHAQSSNRALRSKIWKEVEYDRARFDAEVAHRLVLDPGLSELGLKQAKVFAQCFATVLLEIEGDALLVTSPMRCAIETAMPLVRRAFVPPGRFVCHAEAFEIRSNIYSDERPSELAARLEADFLLTCREVPSDADYPAQSDEESEKESDDHVRGRVERVCAWVDSLVESGDYRVIIMILPKRLLSRCLRRWMRIPAEHELTFVHADTGVTILDWTGEGLVVSSVNEQTHLIAADDDDDSEADDLLRILAGLE